MWRVFYVATEKKISFFLNSALSAPKHIYSIVYLLS